MSEPEAPADSEAALLPTGIYSTGDGQGWQPSSCAGLVCLYSPSERSVVLHGGVAPGMGRTPDLCLGEVLSHAEGIPPTLRWQKVVQSMKIPPRCFHGAALLTGTANGSDKLLIFGGEGNPTVSSSGGSDALLPTGPAMMNDLWEVTLRSGRATNLIATAGAPPTPRTHHVIAVLKDPPPPPPKLAAGRMKKQGLALIMAGRAGAGAAKPVGADKGPAAMAAMAKANAERAAAAAADPRKAFGGGGGKAMGGGMLGLGLGGGRGLGAALAGKWTVLVLGGRAGAFAGPEDALHVLRLSDAGEVRWIPSVVFMREAIRKRQQQQRVQATAEAMIAKGRAEDEAAAASPPPSPRPWGSPRPEEPKEAKPHSPANQQRGQGWAARAAAARAADDLERACSVGRQAFKLLERSAHSAVVSGQVAIVFGGLKRGAPSADLVSVRFRDLATALLPASGMPPPPRHSHAATACGGGMLVCGGIQEKRILDDVCHLSIPQLAWSRLRLPSHQPSRPLAPPNPSGSGQVVMRPPCAASEQLTCTAGALSGCVSHQP